MPKKITLTIVMLVCAVLLAACNGDKMSYSVTVRNAADHAVTLRDISVNGRTYMVQATVLAAADDESASSDYLVVFSGGRTVTVTAEIHDETTGRETRFADQFTDKSGDGYAILLEYNNSSIRSEVSRVGRLSAWGK